jgi:phosphatidylglycerophosphate synthase
MGAGVGMFLAMVGDCLDGMHARRTSQCSRLGELMDHWLDAIVVPLASIGLSYALEMEPWALVSINVTAAMVYHGQLVLYHHTGKFVHPEPATGVEAQFALSIGYVGLAALLFFVDRNQPWLDVAVAGIALLGLFIQARCNLFYYVRLGKLLRYHLLFVVMCSGLGLLYWLGAIDTYAFALVLTFVSFRISGTYVLFTIVRRRYDGNDWGVLAWLAAMFAGYFMAPISLGPFTLQALLPYLACVYMVGRNMRDFSQYYGVLKPSAA